MILIWGMSAWYATNKEYQHDMPPTRNISMICYQQPDLLASQNQNINYTFQTIHVDGQMHDITLEASCHVKNSYATYCSQVFRIHNYINFVYMKVFGLWLRHNRRCNTYLSLCLYNGRMESSLSVVYCEAFFCQLIRTLRNRIRLVEVGFVSFKIISVRLVTGLAARGRG
jgi:hypothetical protein